MMPQRVLTSAATSRSIERQFDPYFLQTAGQSRLLRRRGLERGLGLFLKE